MYLFFTGMNGMTRGTAERAGNHVRTGAEAEADCVPVLRTASYDPLSSSWLREQMCNPNPVSAVIPLKPKNLCQKFTATF